MKKETNDKNLHKDEHKKAQLDRCVTAANPEMIRNNNEDEPCDDNRA